MSVVKEGRATLALAVPLMAGQVSQMLMAVVDTKMIGEIGTLELAASGFANNVLQVPLLITAGLTVAVSIKTSQARGAGTPEKARNGLRNGMYLAFALGVMTLLSAWWILPHLDVFRQDPDVTRRVPGYFMLVALSLIPAFMVMTLKSHTDALNRPWMPMIIVVGSVFLNVFLNWLLIQGNWGFPALGLEGAGLATCAARLASLGGLLWWVSEDRSLERWIPRTWFRGVDWKEAKSLIILAAPAALQIGAEFGAFIAAALVVGSMGEVALAAHQVAFTFSATIYMIPLGLSMALTVRTGEAWGAGQRERLGKIMLSAWVIVLGISLLSMAGLILANEALAEFFVAEGEWETVALAAAIFTVAAIFQVGDQSQITFSGFLRGLDDVAVPAGIMVFCYWVAGVPLGWWLAYQVGMGAVGIWWGLTTGLWLTALGLGFRVWLRLRKEKKTG